MFDKLLVFPNRNAEISNDLLIKTFSSKISFFPQGYNDSDVPSLVSHGIPLSRDLHCIITQPGQYETKILETMKDRSGIRDQSLFDFAYI